MWPVCVGWNGIINSKMSANNIIVTLVVMLVVRASRSDSVDGRNEVCCADLGCFNPGGDFFSFIHRPVNSVPICGLQANLFLRLNTIRNPITTQILNPYDSATIEKSNFNPNQTTKILIHGFLDRYSRPGWRQSTAELLKDGNHNVIRLDWSQGNTPPYVQACANLRLVGSYLAKFIHHIVTVYGVKPSDVHIIGHSLGAHGAGYAGATLQSRYNITIGRITGLDPAGPYFTNMPISVRLDPTDAEIVDTLVTNGDTLLSFGSPQAMGHINFYPNGGLHQPGCSKGVLLSLISRVQGRAAPGFGPLTEVTPFDILAEYAIEPTQGLMATRGLALDTMDIIGCSHNRAVTLFHENIANTSCIMKSFECSNYEMFLEGTGECSSCNGQRCSAMGYHANVSLALKNGVKNFYSITPSQSPFCSKLKVQFTLRNSTTESETRNGQVYITLKGALSNSERILLTPDAIDLKPGKTYSFYPEISKNVGEVKSVIFKWDGNSNGLNPVNWIRKRYISLEGNIILTDHDEMVSVFQPAISKIEERQDISAILINAFEQ